MDIPFLNGIFNLLTTIQIPIIERVIKNILSILKYKQKDFTDRNLESNLLKKFLNLINNLIGRINSQAIFSKGV
ncbi:MAG: hypothetical protein LBU74_02145 [Methanobacteriaceae archaeon]|jgi:hypothetical protein|nr:hypothetical protein [Candidatus Methanorudis spinitermitis]